MQRTVGAQPSKLPIRRFVRVLVVGEHQPRKDVHHVTAVTSIRLLVVLEGEAFCHVLRVELLHLHQRLGGAAGH